MSLHGSGISLYKPRSGSYGTNKDPRNSMSTRLLDDLLVDLVPKQNERNNTRIGTELEHKDTDKGQDQDAINRRKKVIAKFQKLVLLQHASAKRDSTMDRPNDTDASKANNRRDDSTVPNALPVEEQPRLPKVESRSSMKLSKNIHMFSKSFSNLAKIAKTNRSTGIDQDGRCMSADSMLLTSPQGRGSTANENWKDDAPERSSRFSLLKKMNSLSKLSVDTSEHLPNSSYSMLTLDDDSAGVDDTEDNASLGDYVEYALGESLSSASPLNAGVDDQRTLGNSAHKTMAQQSSCPGDERQEHPLSQRRRSLSGSRRSITSIERRSTSRQRNQSRNRRKQTQLHGSDESLRALVEVLSGEVPAPYEEEVPLETKVSQRRKMKRHSLESAGVREQASMPNLRSYEEEALSVRAITGSRGTNRRKECKNDNSSLMHSPRVRSNRSVGSRSLSKLQRFDYGATDSHHNATWDIGGTTEGKVYLRRSVTSKAHQDLLNMNNTPSASMFAGESQEGPKGKEAFHGEEETKFAGGSHRVRSIKTINNRSLPNLQVITYDASTVGCVSNQRRRSTLVRGGKNDEQLPTRSPSAGSMCSMGSRSLAQVDRMNGGIQAGNVTESNRNATWDVHCKRERHSIASLQVRPVRSGKRRSLPNIQSVQDDIDDCGTSRPGAGLDDTSDVTNRKTTEVALDMSSPRVPSLKSKSMGLANRSLPNLQVIDSPRVYQSRPHQEATCDYEEGGRKQQVFLNSPAIQGMRLMANHSLPSLDGFRGHVHGDIIDGPHNATWESGATNSRTQDRHLQLVLRLPKARSALSSAQLSQSLHSNPTTLGVNVIGDDVPTGVLRSSRARRSVRASSQLSQSLHSYPSKLNTASSSGSTMDETYDKDAGSPRRRRSSNRRSIKSSVNRDGDLSIPHRQERDASGDSSITTSSSMENSNEGDIVGTSCETTKLHAATSVSRSSGKSVDMDQSQHKRMPSIKRMDRDNPSSTLSIATSLHSSSLDLLVQTPRPKQRAMQNSWGNNSLPNLQFLASQDDGSDLGASSHNATWDLDEAKEKAKSRSRMLRNSIGSQSFSNLEDTELIGSKTVTSQMEGTKDVGNRLLPSSIHSSPREQPPVAFPIRVR